MQPVLKRTIAPLRETNTIKAKLKSEKSEKSVFKKA